MSRFAYAYFCDDIRLEIGDKTSMMGVYQEALYIPRAPIVLPKLCAMVAVVSPIERAMSQLAMRLVADGNVLVQQEIPPEYLMKARKHMQSRQVEPGDKLNISCALQISSLAIDHAFTIRAYVDVDGEALLAGRLDVEVADAHQAA